MRVILLMMLVGLVAIQCTPNEGSTNKFTKGSHIVLIGNNLCSRMMNYGHFETEMHLRFPDSLLFIRNMCDGGNTPGFRPHSGRCIAVGFSGAEKFQKELAHKSGSEGHFETEDEWLTRLKADIIIACFGYNESFGDRKQLITTRPSLTLLSNIHSAKNTMVFRRHNWLLCRLSPSRTFLINLIYRMDRSRIQGLPCIRMQ